MVAFFTPIFLAGKLLRGFNISPAFLGKTTWNLDVDGPLLLPSAGAWTIKPLAGFAGLIEVWGPGGNGRSVISNATYSNGSPSTVVGGGLSLVANPGTHAPNAGSSQRGAGGTASGGDTNISGDYGETPQAAGPTRGAAGGNGANGGAGGARTGTTLLSKNDGQAPGGGGSGQAPSGNGQYGNPGGGGGGYTKKQVALGSMPVGISLTFTVGAPGVVGNHSGYIPGLGANGRIKIT